MANLFLDIGLIIILATVAAYIVKALKQPPLLGYLLAGVMIGPPVFGLITNTDVIATLSEIGIAFFLFLIGLEMDLRKLKNLGLISLIVGTGQVILTAVAGFAIAAALFGFSATVSLYIALALAFSSTMIVVKLLSDKRELDTLHGRIVVGVLLVQDVISILALTVMPNLGSSSLLTIGESLLKGFGLLLLVFVAGKFLLPGFFRTVSSSRELLFMCSVAWCFLLASFSHVIGYSIAIGAFLAGVSMASLAYSAEIMSMVKSLRDFFATIFFVSLGMQMTISANVLIAPIVVFSALVLFGNPLVVMILMSMFGYNKKVSFLSGVAVAQISEFSLILIALGKTLGHVSQEIVSLTAIVAVITITLSTYMIQHNSQLYMRLSGILWPFEKLSRKVKHMEYTHVNYKADVVLCGHNRVGYSILNKLKSMHKKILVIDHNPELVGALAREKIPCIYGDVGDLDMLDRAGLSSVEMLISTVPNTNDNLLLIRRTKEVNKKAVVISTASQIDEALQLYEAGADYVILPHFLGGDHVSMLIESFANDFDKVLETRLRHIRELSSRKNIGHEHPMHGS